MWRPTLQRTLFEDPVLVDPTFSLEDENRNSLSVILEQPVSDEVAVELRYNGFFQAFGGDDRGSFERHLIYFGVALRPGAADQE